DVAELLALAQIVATGTKLGLLVFGACNAVIGAILLFRAWRRRWAWVATLAAALLTSGSLVSGGAAFSLVEGTPAGREVPSALPGQTQTTVAGGNGRLDSAAGPATTGPGTSSTTAAKVTAPAGSVFEVTIKSGSGVDVDAGPVAATRAAGPNGDL